MAVWQALWLTWVALLVSWLTLRVSLGWQPWGGD
jgi:hypothetical protein